jgi:anti-anti-sigma factor
MGARSAAVAEARKCRRRRGSLLSAEMPDHFSVQRSQSGEATVVRVAGELDLATSPELEHELAQALAATSGPVIVDLRELEFIDSTGLRVLVKAHQQAEKDGRRFGLAGGGTQVRRLLNLTGIGERLALASSPEELLAGD